MRIMFFLALIVIAASCRKPEVVKPHSITGDFGSWQLKYSAPVSLRTGHTSSAVNGKGYVGLGRRYDINPVYLYDWWEYDVTSSTWSQMADFPGRSDMTQKAFAISSSIYILDSCNLYSFNPAINNWTQKNDFPVSQRNCTVVISSDSFVVAGLGNDALPPFTVHRDIWKYDMSNDQWTEIAEFPGLGCVQPNGFIINDALYISGGRYMEANTLKSERQLWAYSFPDDKWTSAGFTPFNTTLATCFTLGNKGFFAGAFPPVTFTGINEYDVVSRTWKNYADSKFSPGCAYFINDGRLYLMESYFNFSDGMNMDDKFWELNP